MNSRAIDQRANFGRRSAETVLTLAVLAAVYVSIASVSWGDEAVPSTSRQAMIEALGRSGIDSRLARWYAGQMLWEEQWRPLEEVQRLSRKDERVAAYRDRRSSIRDVLNDHVQLARWCAKQELTDQAEVHWLHALRFAPEHPAALAALDLAWYDGILMTVDERDRYLHQQKIFAEEQRSWQRTAKRLRRALQHEESAPEARRELAEIRDPAAVPALVEELSQAPEDEGQRLRQLTALVSAVSNIPGSTATEILAAVAVDVDQQSIRYQAIEALKSKDLVETIPTLISGMQLPVEVSISLRQHDQGVASTFAYTQTGPGGYEYRHQDVSYAPILASKYVSTAKYERKKTREGYWKPEKTISYWCSQLNQITYTVRPAEYVAPQYRVFDVGTRYGDNPVYEAHKSAALRKSHAAANGVASQVDQLNHEIELQNRRIAAVLTEVTGATLDAFPKSWWNWWRGYLDEHPAAATQGARRQLNMALLNQDHRGLARGTLVWTIDGRRAIESIIPGDRVLAQDPRSGEIGYKTVLAAAGSPQRQVQQVSMGQAQLYCTAGHVAWQSGIGWQRIGNIEPGGRLHGFSDELGVTDNEQAYAIDAYDLIVDGFHTLFVGNEGVLVHDGTPIAPVDCVLPGISRGVAADVMALAAGP